ncbi:hypothetical protein SAMN05216404_1263 [Nitrosospira multiformis]|uniref:Uncharacterized protein n=1 Tax=Nitrosospira multiformis TaxID=1231 RepID=A0A1H8Q2V4_9PROT|nr:hypothetical protein [Nitrosospira multiformis]SEO48328.1 hypothetical protein SAMN05216404_1263 [Nitrosospira multiformis]
MIGKAEFLSEEDQILLCLSLKSDYAQAKLQAWVQSRQEPFSLSDAGRCLGIPPAYLERYMRIRIGRILKKFGCRRIEKRLETVRFLYLPPEKPHG